MLRKMIVLHYRMQLLKMCEKLNLLVALHSDKYSYLCLFSFSSILRNSFNHCKSIENCSSVIQKWIIPLSFYLTCSSSSCMSQSIGINNLSNGPNLLWWMSQVFAMGLLLHTATVRTFNLSLVWQGNLEKWKMVTKHAFFSKSYSPYAFRRRFRPFDQQSR